jgi:hypothetical protein
MTIQQSLQHVVSHPELTTDDLLNVPASELVCRTLFDIANSAQLKDRRSMARANTARTIIFHRLVGRRKTGSHPATKVTQQITFHDLTGEQK